MATIVDKGEGAAEANRLSGDDTDPVVPVAPSPFRLLAMSLFWFPVNMFWTAMLTSLLPHQVEALVGESAKGTYLAYIAAIGAIATTAIQLVIGPISDASANSWGRRRPFLLVGTVLGVACALFFGYAHNFWALMAAFFGVQLFLNVATGPYQALIPDNVPASRHGVASAYMGVALLVGQLAGALSLLLLKPFGITGVLWLIAPLLLGFMVVTLFLVPDRPAPLSERLPIGDALRTLSDLGVNRYRDFYGLLYSRFFINLSYSTVTAYLLYYLQDAIGPKSAADGYQMKVLLVATVAGLFGTVVAGRMADRISKKRIIYGACAVIGVAALVFAFTRSFNSVLALAFVFGAGWGAFAAVDWAMACNLLPEGGAAKYMAVWHACMTVPQILAPLFGFVADPLNRYYGRGTGWRAAMLSTIIYLALGTVLLRRVHEKPTLLTVA